MINTDRLQAYINHSDRAVEWLLNQLRDDGAFADEHTELTCYFKPAYLFAIAGEIVSANRLLSHIQKKFLQDDGDYRISHDKKSEHVDYYEKIWPYANAWIAFTAHKLGRFEISYPAFDYLLQFRHPEGGFCSTSLQTKMKIVDMLATTHIGHTALFMNNLNVANNCASVLNRFLRMQPEPEKGLFLRLDDQEKLITEYPQGEAGFYYMSTTEPGQFYFMAGYPIAFLAKLYRITRDESHLGLAMHYFDIVENANGVFDIHFSHKAAWGAAALYNITGEDRYAEFALRVADLLQGQQDSQGAWLADLPGHTSLDQTAECATWLREISAELGSALV